MGYNTNSESVSQGVVSVHYGKKRRVFCERFLNLINLMSKEIRISVFPLAKNIYDILHVILECSVRVRTFNADKC